MNTKFRNTKLGWWLLLATALVLGLVITVSAQSPTASNWVTVCHVPPGHPEAAQTMQITWSALDKCLSYFADYMGQCIP